MRKKTDRTPDLEMRRSAVTASPAPVPTKEGPPVPSGVIEYQPEPAGEFWRVELFADLAAEFRLELSDLPDFHRLNAPHGRSWLFLRQRFGILPVILPMDADPDEHRVFSVAELCARHGLEAKQLRAEWDAVRALWEQARAALEAE